MVKALSVVERLEKAVSDYLLWMISADYASGSITKHERLLNHFQNFITNRNISWEQVFTYDTLNTDFHRWLNRHSLPLIFP